MASPRTKRVLFFLAFFVVIVLAVAVYFGYRLSRNQPFDWGEANVIESKEARRKIKLYETSHAGGQKGFVRFSELEINSFLKSLTTNLSAAPHETAATAKTTTSTNSATPNSTNQTNVVSATVTNEVSEPLPALALSPEAGVRLTKAGVSLTKTNFTLFTWGESKFWRFPVRFVAQREFEVQQSGTNQWEIPLQTLKIGDLEIPRRFWEYFQPTLAPIDQALLAQIPWRTNIQAILVNLNPTGKRPEVRLYTYKPIPPEDLR